MNAEDLGESERGIGGNKLEIGKIISTMIGDDDDYDTLANLMKMRMVSREWKLAIESLVSRIGTFSKVYNCCRNILWFDLLTYDQHHYKRLLLREVLDRLLIQYNNMVLPVINEYEYDLDGESLNQYSVGQAIMPDEYYIFLEAWGLYPSTTVHPIPLQILESILKNQFNWLEKLILSMDSQDDLKRLVTYCPMLYRIDEQKNIMKILCYVNVVDSDLELDFPIDSERFCVISCPIDVSQAVVGESGFEPAILGVSDACINISGSSGDGGFHAGDVIEVTETKHNNGFYEVQISDARRILLRGVGENPLTSGELATANQLIKEVKEKDAKNALICGDTIRSGFRKFEYESIMLTEKIRLGTETRYLPKNVASELSGFASLIRKF